MGEWASTHICVQFVGSLNDPLSTEPVGLTVLVLLSDSLQPKLSTGYSGCFNVVYTLCWWYYIFELLVMQPCSYLIYRALTSNNLYNTLLLTITAHITYSQMNTSVPFACQINISKHFLVNEQMKNFDVALWSQWRVMVWIVNLPFELFIETVNQQLMLLCLSALLTSDTCKLALQFVWLVLQRQKTKHQ